MSTSPSRSSSRAASSSRPWRLASSFSEDPTLAWSTVPQVLHGVCCLRLQVLGPSSVSSLFFSPARAQPPYPSPQWPAYAHPCTTHAAIHLSMRPCTRRPRNASPRRRTPKPELPSYANEQAFIHVPYACVRTCRHSLARHLSRCAGMLCIGVAAFTLVDRYWFRVWGIVCRVLGMRVTGGGFQLMSSSLVLGIENRVEQKTHKHTHTHTHTHTG
jgi:hypothetical protein